MEKEKSSPSLWSNKNVSHMWSEMLLVVLSCIMRMHGCWSWDSICPGAIGVFPSLVSTPSWAVGMGDDHSRHLRDKMDINRSGGQGAGWGVWQKKQTCKMYVTEQKAAQPHIWPANLCFSVLPEKVSVCNVCALCCSSGTEKRKKPTSATEMRWEETDEKEKTLNCALDCLPLMDLPLPSAAS